jgi:DNA-directed RNA polymerase subunit H (RpoH/RPB5)
MEQAHMICLEMLRQRDYTKIELPSEDRILAVRPDGGTVLVFLMTDISNSKLSIKVFESCIVEMTLRKVAHAIIVYRDGVTPCTRKAIEQLPDKQFELFAEEDLQYNITKHRLQPKFERLSSEAAERFKKSFGLQFPIMRSNDPVARFLGYKRNDVIKVETTRGMFSCVTFRIVKG